MKRRDVRGLVLIMVMLFLVLLTTLSISAFRSSTTNLRATSNMMVRQEALSAAQAAIETTLSAPNEFEVSPAAARVETVDLDGDGGTDYTVTVRPADTCSKIRQLRFEELPGVAATGLPTEAWKRCDPGTAGSAVGSGAAGPGLIEITGTTGGSSGKTFCVETRWDVQATVNDARTGAIVEVHQGVAIPYSISESRDRCNRS